MAEEQPLERGIIEFHTAGCWTASELESLLRGLNRNYKVFMLLTFLKDSAADRANRGLEYHQKLFKDKIPDLYEFYEKYYQLWQLYGLPPGMIFPISDYGGVIQESIEPYFHNIDIILPNSQALIVKRIEMASPGLISLEGLAETLRQLRELIKDLWYRNRQEEELGGLRIIQEKLAIYSQYKLTPQQIQTLSLDVLKNSKILEELHKANKLSIQEGEPPKPSRKLRKAF